MSNELRVALDGYFKKGDAPPWEAREYFKKTIGGDNSLTGNVMEIGTSGNTLTKPSGIATVRHLYLKNLDSVYGVWYGDETSQPGYLEPKEPVITGWNATQVKCVASTASMKVSYCLWDKS